MDSHGKMLAFVICAFIVFATILICVMGYINVHKPYPAVIVPTCICPVPAAPLGTLSE